LAEVRSRWQQEAVLNGLRNVRETAVTS